MTHAPGAQLVQVFLKKKVKWPTLLLWVNNYRHFFFCLILFFINLYLCSRSGWSTPGPALNRYDSVPARQGMILPVCWKLRFNPLFKSLMKIHSHRFRNKFSLPTTVSSELLSIRYCDHSCSDVKAVLKLLNSEENSIKIRAFLESIGFKTWCFRSKLYKSNCKILTNSFRRLCAIQNQGWKNSWNWILKLSKCSFLWIEKLRIKQNSQLILIIFSFVDI